MTSAYVDLNTLHNPATATKPTVAWGDQIRTNFETLAKAPGCMVARATAQTISTGTPTAIAFTSETRDTDAFHDNATNNTQLKVPAGSGLGGVYAVSACVGFAVNSTGARAIYLRVGGATTKAAVRIAAFATDSPFLVVYDEIALAETEYVEVVVVQSSTGNLDTIAGATATMRLVAL